MRPNRRIKRDHSRPFFSHKRRGLSGLPLLFFVVFTLGISIGLVLVTATRYDELRYLAEDALGIAPTYTPRAIEYAQSGLALYGEGKASEALVAFGMALTPQPDNIDYLYEYGRALIELDEYDRAAPIGDRAIAVAPNDARGYALKARALMWSDPGSAIPVAVSGLEIDPNFAPLHAALAVAYTNSGRYAEALQRGSRAVDLDPLDSFAHRAYSIPLIFTGRYSQAIEALEQAVAINPNLTGPYFELAAQYRRIDFQEMAVGIYRRVLELDPNNAKAYLRICETYAEVGEFQEGSSFCETAIEINPQYASAWRMLGQLQYNRRNYESAITSFENCVRPSVPSRSNAITSVAGPITSWETAMMPGMCCRTRSTTLSRRKSSTGSISVSPTYGSIARATKTRSCPRPSRLPRFRRRPSEASKGCASSVITRILSSGNPSATGCEIR